MSQLKVPISVLIFTNNEELHIQDCLESVTWADEIFLVDSFSQDRTVEIARCYTERIYQKEFKGLGAKKNWAFQNLTFSHEWVLSVDADEKIPEMLRDEIAVSIATSKVDGYLIRQRYYFFGKALEHAVGSLFKLKLFKWRKYRCEETIHEYAIFNGRTACLKYPYDHIDRRSLSDYIQRHNKYSSQEAELYLQMRGQKLDFNPIRFLSADSSAKKQMLKRIWVRFPIWARPPVMFCWFYFLKMGFLDGIQGLIFSILRGAIYEFHVSVKLWEKRHSMMEVAASGKYSDSSRGEAEI
jgi:glycosyltransferase involved in cell wall biosynthesis